MIPKQCCCHLFCVCTQSVRIIPKQRYCYLLCAGVQSVQIIAQGVWCIHGIRNNNTSSDHLIK